MTEAIAVIGGGLVGLSAALALSHQGRQVRILESFPLKIENPHKMDARSIALSYSTVQIFRSLGIWDKLIPHVSPISNIHVSTAGHFGVTRLAAADLKLDAMGYVIEYHQLIAVLFDCVQQDSAIEVISPARVEQITEQESGVSLSYHLNDEPLELGTPLVIIADGSNSKLSDALGIRYEEMDYEQSAIIANVSIERDGAGWAYERFTPEGPLALLPLSDQRYALVWTQSLEQAELRLQLSDNEFLQQLHDCFGYRLGLFSGVGKRAVFNLKRLQASGLVSGSCVLLGNAANTLHPVAGQGFNLALRDIARLYDQLLGLDFNTDDLVRALQGYQDRRRDDQTKTVAYGHYLVQLFSNDLPVLNHVRAGALAMMDVAPLLKQQASWTGMGYGADCSSLMRGQV